MAGNGPANAGRPAAPKVTRRVNPRRRQRPYQWARFAILTVLAATIGGAAVLVAPSLFAVPVPAQSATRLDAILIAAGFGIDEAVISGHRYTADSDLFDALDLAHTPTMAALNSTQVQARLLRLPWIATASLTRVYPGRVEIAVTERTPYAAWTNPAGTVILVDETGRELSPVRDTDWPALPRIAGAGAPAEAAALFQMLGYFPAIASRLERASRITARRWQLHLTGGVRLELPPEGEATAIANLLANPSAATHLEKPGTIIDLRSPTRIAARPSLPASAGGL